MAINAFYDQEPAIMIFSNDTDNRPYLILQKSGRITCIKGSGYKNDVRVQVLKDDGTIPDDPHSAMTIFKNQEQLKQFGSEN